MFYMRKYVMRLHVCVCFVIFSLGNGWIDLYDFLCTVSLHRGITQCHKLLYDFVRVRYFFLFDSKSKLIGGQKIK